MANACMAPDSAPTARPCHAQLGEAPLGLGLAPRAPAAAGASRKAWSQRGQRPIASERQGRLAGRTWLLPRGEEKAAPRLCTVAFYFHGRLEACRGPWDTDINNQIPGTAAAGDLSELIFPLFSSVES